MLHRFYCRNKFEEYPYEEVACVCLFITMKVEHSKAIPIKHLIEVAGKTTKPLTTSTTKPSTSKPLTEKRITSLELYVLAQLCFDITPPAPLPLLLEHIKNISAAGEDVLMKAMTHCKDAHRTTLPVRVSMSDLAKASIRYAMRFSSSDNSVNGAGNDSAGFDITYQLVQRILDHLYSPESVKTIRKK